MKLERGLYALLMTEQLEAAVASLEAALMATQEPLESAEAPDRLTLHLSRVIERVLASLPADQRVQAGTALVGELIRHAVRDRRPELLGQVPSGSGRVLTEVASHRPDGQIARVPTPVVPLIDTALMTNSPGEPRLLAQLVSEIPSAHGIDLIMAFIRRSGIAPMRETLGRHARVQTRPLRVLTTTYTGSTEVGALEELQQLGADVRVSYDTSTTRLHAKAWLFHRPLGMSTGFIGSSNLTHSAQVTGLEWNLRVSEARNRTVLERMTALFESCWNSGDFVDFDAAAFREAVKAQKGAAATVLLPGIELRLEPFQERLLELIEIERESGRHRNLLVSATGTGKTVMAAVDYARLRERLPRARLLFVAHRKEILEQSRATFRYALRDASFGETWVDGERPEHFEHVFASVQSLSRVDLQHLAPDHFDVVIVDEFHHAAAPTYRALLHHLNPPELLGLTATPERTDGESVLSWFGGRIAAELRLWDAIDKQRLVPFAYYGVADDTDLSQIPWRRGRGYDVEALSNLLTADDAWARRVIQQLLSRVDDLSQIRALGFCVSVDHARFMARVFNSHGINAVAVHAGSTVDERQDALRKLAVRHIQIVFSVDLFNEGVDVPAVDTLLLLRPTDSPTLFLQQLGRGLRRHPEKALCTVLDFVGQHRREFSFDRRLRALLGGTRKQLIEQVEQGFPFLPAGCHMVLEGVARDRVLQNLKEAVPRGLIRMADEMRRLRDEGIDLTLSSFLEHSGLESDDVYAGSRCWSDLLAAAGEPVLPPGPYEAALRKACGRLLHLDDGSRVVAYLEWLKAAGAPRMESLTKAEARWMRMLLASLLSAVPQMAQAPTADAVRALWQHPQILRELRELFEVLRQHRPHLGGGLSIRPNVPLRIHSRYSRLEIQSAFGDAAGQAAEHDRVVPPTWREGVKWMDGEKADVFLVTFNKTEKRFSPTTRYRDYAISRDLLHWESQSGTTEASPTGTRYRLHLTQGSAVMIFARMNSDDRAFYFLGPATYVRHQGEMPMQITWRLTHSLPGDLFSEFAGAAA